MLVQNISELIGATPCLRAKNFEKACNIESSIYAKLECFNPSGSIKDRIAISMIKTAEQAGELLPGSTIIEATSGNTGISLAYICKTLGYRCKIVMPDTPNTPRQKMLSAYGAQVVLTDASLGMKGALLKAKELSGTIPNSYMPMQFENPSNPQAHRITTAYELLLDIPAIDILICSVGTGGTITGVGEELKKFNPNTKVIAVEPLESAVLSGCACGTHSIEGIGAGFIPNVLNLDIIDEVITVSSADAEHFMKGFALQEGISVGISSGAVLCAANKAAKQNTGKNIALILPDSGMKYLNLYS